MKDFISQNKKTLLSKKRRWQPKGRQVKKEPLLEIKSLLNRNNFYRDELIEYLHIIQDHYGILYAKHLEALALLLNIPFAEVYEVSTFYSHFNVSKDNDAKPSDVIIRVCENLTCSMFGSDSLFDKLNSIDNLNLKVLPAPCMGRCQNAPTVCVGKNYIDNANFEKVLKAIENKNYKAKIPKYIDFNNYLKNGGYKIYKKIINKQISTKEVKNLVQESNLKGKGGAGFPTYKKWEFVNFYPEPRYLAINADEGEVGTFKDRHYMESDPHRFLEGILISSEIVNAKKIFIYLRDEYPAVMSILESEIQKLEIKNIIEKNYIILRRGAGAYICGEESAMIESIEGKRGLPRHRPPFVAEKGLFGRPTLVNNVETVYWLRDIIEKGPRWFSKKGKNGRKGFHSFSVSGRINNPGVKIAPAGTTVQELIDDYCDGMIEGHIFKAYLPGGASGGILPASLNNIPLDYGVEDLATHDCFLGSAAIIILSDHDSIKNVGLNLLKFFEDESCGQCTPCRVGTEKTVIEMRKNKWDKTKLNDLSKVMVEASICGLGQAASNPLKSILKHFSSELENE
ncbi:MAG: NADH-quinone oxidoreductase subunit F [Alphaproteobacteria bacterium MarineAlpha5_Bin9]|nr:MAG: NADH-quinone oxidoreductase subunit F [Alphaproteobacteria bacterium MarineAlpha5_Bin9]|tara:strand:+ start:3631 stop:5334 length:1704 start_codon:yes stop_codon:yes gene_type:complete